MTEKYKNIMVLTLPRAGEFKAVVKLLKTLGYDTGVFFVKKDRMYFKDFDPSHTVIVDYILPAEVFKTFKTEKELLLGINIEMLYKIMLRVNSGSELTLCVDERGNKLQFETKGKSSRTFTLGLIEMEAPEDRNLVGNRLAVTRYYDLDILGDAIKDTDLFGVYLKYAMDDKGSSFFAKNDYGEAFVEVARKKGVSDGKAKRNCHSQYKIDVLKPLTELFALSEYATMELYLVDEEAEEDCLPLKIILSLYPIGKPKDKEEAKKMKRSSLGVVIAPKVESSEEQEELVEEEIEEEPKKAKPKKVKKVKKVKKSKKKKGTKAKEEESVDVDKGGEKPKEEPTKSIEDLEEEFQKEFADF